jgi:hypothetical protein
MKTTIKLVTDYNKEEGLLYVNDILVNHSSYPDYNKDISLFSEVVKAVKGADQIFNFVIESKAYEETQWMVCVLSQTNTVDTFIRTALDYFLNDADLVGEDSDYFIHTIIVTIANKGE